MSIQEKKQDGQVIDFFFPSFPGEGLESIGIDPGWVWSSLVCILFFFIHLFLGRVYRVLGLILGESGQVWSIVYCTILLLLLTRLTQDQFQYSLYPLQEKERKKKYTDQTWPDSPRINSNTLYTLPRKRWGKKRLTRPDQKTKIA